MPLNIYSIFVVPPATGKSQANKKCAFSPLSSLTEETDSTSPVIQKSTSSGLIMAVADNNRTPLVSGEIYDVLFMLLKSDEENATGDVLALCQLFPDKEASFRYATATTREIAADTPFCILGATQIPFAARLVTLLDQGHGLLDRFLITFPKCLRPTPTQPAKPSKRWKKMALQTAMTFSSKVNGAIMEGRIPPKTKMMDVIFACCSRPSYFQPCHFTSACTKRTNTASRRNWEVDVPKSHWLRYLGGVTKINLPWGNYFLSLLSYFPWLLRTLYPRQKGGLGGSVKKRNSMQPLKKEQVSSVQERHQRTKLCCLSVKCKHYFCWTKSWSVTCNVFAAIHIHSTSN